MIWLLRMPSFNLVRVLVVECLAMPMLSFYLTRAFNQMTCPTIETQQRLHEFRTYSCLCVSSLPQLWFIHQRANFSIEGRNSFLAGRAGTRLNIDIGRPHTIWEAGHAAAVHMFGHRTKNERSSNMLCGETLFRETRAVLGLL